MRRFIVILAITILAGAHQASVTLAQLYGPGPYGRRGSYSEFDRPYGQRDRDIYSPERWRENQRQEERARRYRRELQGREPYRPY